MKTKTCFLQSILLMSFTATVCAQSETPTKDLPPSGNWAATPVTADGVLNEWPASLRYVAEEMPLAYDITNDGTNLYVAVRTTDPTLQVNILRAGITLGVNIKGKKKITSAVTYPKIEGSVLFAQRRRNAQAAAGNDTGGGSRYERPSASARPVPADLYRELRPYMDNAGVKGITGLEDGTINVAQRKTGIAAALELNEGDSLSVEFVIPLSKLGLTSAYAKEIAYSITVNEDDGTGNGRGGRGPRMGGVGIGLGVGGGMGVGMGSGVGMNIGGFGGRDLNGGGGKNGNANTVWIKQPLARQPG